MASNLSRVLSGMDETVIGATDEMLIINPDSRQIDLPSVELTFGVEHDAGAERKYFQAPRYVGKGLDLASCFLRVNFRNANGEIDAYLVEDATVTADGLYVTFSWELSRKVTQYRGSVQFVVCAVGTDQRLEWHTTLATGLVLEGLEPDAVAVENATKDVIAQLLALVDAQTASVEAAGAEQVSKVKAEGATQIEAVQAASEAAETASVAEIEAKGVNTLASIPADYTSLGNAVEGLVRGRAGVIVCEAAGSAVAVNDASDLPMQGLRIFGRSTQDGTPTPDAPVEIVSVDKPVVTVYGKNLLPNAATNESYNGITIIVNEDKSITVNGTATGNVFYAPYRFTFQAGRSYVLSGCPRNGSADTYFMYINNLGGMRDYGNGVVVKLDEDFTSDVGFSIRAGTTVNNLTFYPMVKIGVAVDVYEPRKPTQTIELTHTLPGIPVTSGGNYTDSDGQQWICDEVDLERGVYVQRVRVKVVDGVTPGLTVTDKTQVTTNLARFNMWGNVKVGGKLAVCTHYPASLWIYDEVKTAICSNPSSSLISFFEVERSNYTREEFNAWLNEQYANGTPVTIQYVLETPIETALSESEIAAYRAMHTNYPNTTVLNDSGAHMVVKYAADTKLYIDNKIKEALQ